MKPKVWLCWVLFLVPIVAMGQNSDKWKAGSAYVLQGKVCNLSCFVSDSTDNWTYAEKLDVLEKLKAANAWTTSQAKRYQVAVDFQSFTFGMQSDIELPKIESGTGSGNEDVGLVSVVFELIGYKRPLEFWDWVKTKTDCNNANVLLFIKGKGTSYSMAYSEDMDSELYFVEGSVLYNQYLSGPLLSPSSIAHEMLHLYGAWDFYTTFQQTADREVKARELFPNSVMLRHAYDINELEVDSLTAWLVGWNPNPAPWYEWFRPR